MPENENESLQRSALLEEWESEHRPLAIVAEMSCVVCGLPISLHDDGWCPHELYPDRYAAPERRERWAA